MKYTDELKATINLLSASGSSSRKIAKVLGISKSGVNDYLAKVDAKVNIQKIPTAPRILLLDLESAPTIAAVFGRFKQNISLDAVVSEGGWLITAVTKWLGEPDVIKLQCSTNDALLQDDSYIVNKLYDLIEECDLLVAHNLEGFDLPLLKSRCMLNGLPALKKVKTIDTLKIARQMRFNSAKLDNLCSQLGIGRKQSHSGIDLWMRCMQGEQKALDEMLEYNVQDVHLLEELYLILRSYDIKHPNLAVYYNDDKLRCNVCGSTNLTPTDNNSYTNLSRFKEYKCNYCGTRLRDRSNSLSKTKRSNLLSN